LLYSLASLYLFYYFGEFIWRKNHVGDWGRGRIPKKWRIPAKSSCFLLPESVEGLHKFLGVAEDGDEVRLGAGIGSLAKFFSWPSKRRAG
jgi:hypothetical protein